MAMTPEDTKKVAQFVDSKWRSSKCTLCGVNKWAIHGYVQVVLGPDHKTINLGGQVLPSAAFVCKNCGNTVLVNLLMAGVIVPDKAEPSGGDGGRDG
jgi:hypothetical protein